MYKLVTTIFIALSIQLFAQEEPVVIASVGLVRHDDDRSRKWWNTGDSYDLNLRLKQTDIGALYLDVAYMDFRFDSKHWINAYYFHNSNWFVKAKDKSIIRAGLSPAFSKEIKPIVLTALFGVGILFENEPHARLYFTENGSAVFFRSAKKQRIPYFRAKIGINYNTTKWLGIGIASGYMFSIFGAVRGLFFPICVDARICL